MSQSYIFLVEDNPDDAFLVSRIIGKVCSEAVLVARDGEEAIQLLQKMAEDESYRQIRLVLLDLKLPKINGIEVLQSIRSSAPLRNLPVAVLTSSENDIDQERCRALGVLDYIFKPLTADRLQRLLALNKDD
jgi:CheY-like chemotaxis protein